MPTRKKVAPAVMEKRVLQWVKAVQDNERLSGRALARVLGLSPTHIRRLLSGEGKPGFDTLAALANHLDLRGLDILKTDPIPHHRGAKRALPPAGSWNIFAEPWGAKAPLEVHPDDWYREQRGHLRDKLMEWWDVLVWVRNKDRVNEQLLGWVLWLTVCSLTLAVAEALDPAAVEWVNEVAYLAANDPWLMGPEASKLVRVGKHAKGQYVRRTPEPDAK
jgi:transcriptional regulator with XRE-family HTH domain